MNTIEQQLWDYIDGNLSPIEIKAIEEKISSDSAIKTQYEELLALSNVFSELDLDEPSMSFTRNVMEDVALLPAPVALKTKVDKRIIYIISGFFVLSILALFSYVLYNSDFSIQNLTPAVKVDLQLSKIITPTTTYIFLFADLVIGLVFLDYLIRKKTANKV